MRALSVLTNILSRVAILGVFLIACGALNKLKAAEKQAILQFRLSGMDQIDSLQVALYPHMFDSRNVYLSGGDIKTAYKNKQGFFVFKINTAVPLYFNLFYQLPTAKNRQNILQLYLVEPGDIIRGTINKKELKEKFAIEPSHYFFYDISFSGRGSEKYSCKHELDKILYTDEHTRFETLTADGNFIAHNGYDLKHTQSRIILKQYQSRISLFAYRVFQADYFSEIELQHLGYIRDGYALSSLDSALIKKIRNKYRLLTDSMASILSDGGKIFSASYCLFLVERSMMSKRYIRNSKETDPKKNYPYEIFWELRNTYSGELKDKLLTLATQLFYNMPAGQSIIDEALSVIQTDYCEEAVRHLADANSVGKPAYNFSLPDSSGQLVKLESFKGKVVFIDFWYTGCPGCMRYYTKTLSKIEHQFKDNPDIVFMTVNIDKNRSEWIKSINGNKYTSTDVINLNTAGLGTNHPIIDHYRVTSYPRPLLIGRDGKIFSNNRSELFEGFAKLEETINKALGINTGLSGPVITQ